MTPDAPHQSRSSLLSASQAGWAFSLATLAALAVGVFVVGGLGRADSAPPLEIESGSAPAPKEPAYQILSPDNASAAGAPPSPSSRHADKQRQRWAEAFRPRSAEKR